MDALLTKFAQQQEEAVKKPVATDTVPTEGNEHTDAADMPSSSVVSTPDSDIAAIEVAITNDSGSADVDKAEMVRLKNELEAAKHQLEMQKRELDQNRILNHTLDQAMGPGVEDVGANKGGLNTAIRTHLKPSFATSYLGNPRQEPDTFSDTSDVYSNYSNLPPNAWSSAPRPSLISSPPRPQFHQPVPIWGQSAAARQFNSRVPVPGPGMPPAAMIHPQPMPQHRILSGPASPGAIGDGRFVNDFSQYQSGFGLRRHNVPSPRNDVPAPQHRINNSGWSVVGNGLGGLEAMNLGMNPNNPYQPMGMYQPPVPYQPRPIGTPLSPTAAEFRADQPPGNPWNTAVSQALHRMLPWILTVHDRLLPHPVRCMSSQWSHSITDVFSIGASLATGHTLLIRSCAITTSKHPSSCSKNLKSVRWNKSMRSSRPLLLRPILS